VTLSFDQQLASGEKSGGSLGRHSTRARVERIAFSTPLA
jgi:hypothetical protein